MIFLSKAELQQRQEIVRQMKSGDLEEGVAIERLLELFPDDAIPYLLKASQFRPEIDLDEVERWLWLALERRPCYHFCYLSLADVRLKRNAEDLLGKHLRCLALWKVAESVEVPDDAANTFRPFFEKAGGDAEDPGSYYDLAMGLEEDLKDEVLPAEATERLLPYRLLNELQLNAPDTLDSELLHNILANSERVIPLWRAALREWAGSADEVSPEALALMIATLGEMAGMETLDELFELACVSDPEISLHANWALFRMGQRFLAEALERYRALAPSALVGQRCALAEQIDLLPDLPGREDALVDLLEGFSRFVQDRDAAYLLAVVVYALGESGQETRARQVLLENEPALPKPGRKQLRKLLDMEDGFVPALLSMGIDELDIEDVCVEGVLLGEADEADDEEDTAPAPPRVKPGRNDPCWCGSGRKYKKCHLAADEEAERTGRRAEPEEHETEVPPGNPLHMKLMGNLMDFAAEFRSRADMREADRLYFGDLGGGPDNDERVESGFLEWFVYDFRPRGKGATLIEEYLRRRGGRLPAAERNMLESWLDARFGLYEVQRVEEGTGVELKDVFGGEPFFVHDVSSSRELVQWDAIFSRVEEFEGRRIFSGNGVTVPRANLPDMMSLIEEESREAGETPSAYLRASSHRWYRETREQARQRMRDMKVVNAEGDAMELCSATYAVRDEQAAADALASSKVFEPQPSKGDPPGVRHFGWMEVREEGPRRSYGHLELSGGRLRLECNSRRRLEIGRSLLDKYAGAWLEHQGDECRSLQEAMEQRRREGPVPKAPESGIPPEVERELILKMKSEHYAKWADDPLPALEGRTPREAVRSATGRKAVEDLLRMMENGEERERKLGKAAFDFSGIRRELGLATRG